MSPGDLLLPAGLFLIYADSKMFRQTKDRFDLRVPRAKKDTKGQKVGLESELKANSMVEFLVQSN